MSTTPSLSSSVSYIHTPSAIEASANTDTESHSDVDSLPSSPSTSSSSGASYLVDHSDADREWKESLQQLELILTMVLVPYLGKYFGRKCAYWGWAKYMQWKYPVEVVVTSKAAFKGAGAVEAMASI